MRRSSKLVRRTLASLLVGFVLMLMALVGVSHLGPLAGFQVFIVRGGSMAPTIPLGSLVAAHTTVPADITAGDVVTFRLPNGIAVTHRVIELVDEPDGLYLQTKGDANNTLDPDLIPATAVVGVVDRFVPLAGYVLAMLSIPSGLVSVVALLVAMLLGIWIIDDHEAEDRAAAEAVTASGQRTGEATS